MALPRSYTPFGAPKESAGFKILVGLGLIFSAVALFAWAFGSTVNNVSGRTHDLAQAEAEKFLRNAGINGIAQCANTDSDGDGYVSCPYTTRDGSLHALECAGSMTVNAGCRPPKAIITPQIGR